MGAVVSNFVKIQPHMKNSRKDISLAALLSLQFTCTSGEPLPLLIEPFFLTIKVVRLDERDRYRQLVAQFTTIQTPESVGATWNRIVDEPLHIDTDFLTKTRPHGRYSVDGCK